MLVFLFATLLCVILPFPLAVQSAAETIDMEQQGTVAQETPSGPVEGDIMPPAFNLLDEIRRAQEFLQNKSAGYGQRYCKTKVTFVDKRGRKRTKLRYGTIVKPNFLLAVENLRDRQLQEVLVTEKGCATEGFHVIQLRINGVASRFRVAYPEDMAVLAIRTIVHGRYGDYEEVVYTPYGPEIDTPEIRGAGYTYLRDQIESARTDLENRGVRLRALGSLVQSGRLADLLLVLSIIEHMDPGRFKACPYDQLGALIREVLTVVGANASNAYAYSKSPAGARGLFQFIPSTYERIRRKYPAAALNRDFVLGSMDHVNGAKASILLFESDLADLPRKLLAGAGDNIDLVGRYLAASYNCGPKRVKKSAGACSDAWTRRLPEETRTYLKKFDAVWELRDSLP